MDILSVNIDIQQSKSLAQIRDTFAEIHNFFLGDCFYWHPLYDTGFMSKTVFELMTDIIFSMTGPPWRPLAPTAPKV